MGRNKFLITFLIGAFLLYALFTWILPTLIGGLSFFNRFKGIPKKEASVSENSILAPPVLNIPFEATNTASIFIRGYSIPGASVEIYVDGDLKATSKASDDGSFITDPVELSLGTNNISGKTVDEKGGKSLPSKHIKIIYDNDKPKLDVKEPSDNQEIKGGDKKVTVAGTTNSEKDITVMVNGIRVIVSPDGSFFQKIDINEGENNLSITATDTFGNTTQVTRKVIFIPQ